MIEKYKLPDGWKWVKLGEVCEINPPKPKGFSRPSDAPTTFVPMSAVDEKAGTIREPEIVPYSKVAKGYTYFEENDVLFAKITPCMQNGKHVIAKNLIDGIGFGTTEFHVLRPNNNVLPEWIHFFIRQSSFLQEATAYFTGAVGQQRIPHYFLADYIIPLPPLSDQRRIISKLQELMQDIERARTACEKQLEAADALPSAYLREVFESEESKKWERKRLGDIYEVCQYGLTATATDNKGFPYIRITDIDDWGNIKIDAIKYVNCDENAYIKYELKEGDILFARSGSIGRTLLYNGIPPKAMFASYLIRFRLKLNIIDPHYLFYYTHSPEYYKFIEEKKHTVSQPNINADEYKLLQIPLPSLETQRHIATELKEKMAYVEKLKSAIQNQKSALDALPQAILRKAFRGEL